MKLSMLKSFFMTGQKFITRKGEIHRLADLAGKRVGVANGTTAGDTLKHALPSALVGTYDGYSRLLQALATGEVDAVTTDGDILQGLFAQLPGREAFEIPKIQISGDALGFGLRKGDARFVQFVNQSIVDLEKSGEADRIFERWFGPDTPYSRVKNFNQGIK